MGSKLFLEGVIIGFSIGMAVGPIALLCIRNSLTRGFRQGFATGLGAAAADAMYGAVAGFGVMAVTSALLHYRIVFQVVGGLFLCYLGLTCFFVKEARERKETVCDRCWPIFTTTFLLTMTNPMTILSFIAIYAGLGVGGGESGLISACLLTAGIFLGSALWYVLLSYVTSVFKSKLTVAASRWLNRVSGCIIFGFGIAAFAMAIR